VTAPGKVAGIRALAKAGGAFHTQYLMALENAAPALLDAVEAARAMQVNEFGTSEFKAGRAALDKALAALEES
jgi:hypothetical protein